MRKILFPISFLILLVLLFHTQAEAQSISQSIEGSTEAISTEQSSPLEWLSLLDSFELELSQSGVVDATRSSSISSEIAKIQRSARAASRSASTRLAPLRRELESLGAAPEDGQPAELAKDAAIREQLQARIQQNESIQRLSRLALVRTQNLQDRLADIAVFTLKSDLLLVRTPSVFRIGTWSTAADTGAKLIAQLFAAPIGYFNKASGWRAWRPLLIILLLVTAAFAANFGRRGLQIWIAERRSSIVPSYSTKILMAFSSALAVSALPLSSFGVTALAAYLLPGSQTLFSAFIFAFCMLATYYFLLSGIATAVFQPDEPQWRLTPVSDADARQISRKVRLIGLISGAGVFAVYLSNVATVQSEEFASIVAFVSNISIVFLGFRILPHRFLAGEIDKSHPEVWFISIVLFLILAAVVIADLAAYSKLSSYLLINLIITTVALGIAILTRAVVHEGIDWLINMQGKLRKKISRNPEDTKGLGLLQLFAGITADLILFVPLFWLLLTIYGVPSARLQIWMGYFVNGVTIGKFTISPFEIILAIIVFSATLFLTNIVRRSMARRVSSRTNIDVGIRNAIVSGVGYIGIVIAVVLAVATLGLDLTNLALFASALSVGLGFGLRNVVENFIAGILLLIERPIKEGDWIVVGGRNGTVKRISVRSTEVETFDRSTIIVPNSELFSNSVENWSHRNRNARVTIPIGVAYGSDTQKVREVLTECIETNDDILKSPAPQVLFLGFGDSSLDFEVRYFIRDTDLFIRTKSDLHFAIDKAFRETGIEIPFPQRDVHIKSK